MLSRTASDLYWMSRLLERAENTARLLDVSYSLALIPTLEAADAVAAPLRITGVLDLFNEHHEALTPEAVLTFFAFDERNPASICGHIRQARENALSVRGSISGDVWESVNSTWLELQAMQERGLEAGGSHFFEWVKERSHSYRGAAYGTMLRGEAFRFVRLGTYIERADNTARILRLRAALVGSEMDGAVDFYRWSALLRSLAAQVAYQSLYRGAITAELVTELLVLRPEVPRSLRRCVEYITDILDRLDGARGRTAQRLSAELRAQFRYYAVEEHGADRRYATDELLADGLPAFLDDFLGSIYTLGEEIHRAYLQIP